MNKEENAELLASAYRTSLELAVENSIRHVVSYILFLLLVFSRHLHQAFPSISTGIYAYPIRGATRVALNEVRSFLESVNGNEVSTPHFSFLASSDLENLKQLERVIFVVWSDRDKAVYE